MGVQPHPFLLSIARALLEKADRSRGEANTRLKLTAANAAPMFQATDAEALRLYELLLGEFTQTGWVRLHLRKPRDFQTFVEREPTLELLDFSSLATWAGYQSRHEAWDRLLVAHLRTSEVMDRFGKQGAALAEYLARSPMPALEHMGVEGATSALERLHQTCRDGGQLPLRELSARVFQGRSKVLDNRGELLRVLGAQPSQFKEAPIQLLASVPPAPTEVLFIENLLTFETMAGQRQTAWSDAILLYAAGFRGGARRLLEPGGSVVYLREDGPSGGAHTVRSFLQRPARTPVAFYGDLDFAGMDILRNLRQVFSHAQSWRPGYEALVAVLRSGGGHRPAWAEKERQSDPGATGCEWTDEVLLAALREFGRFVDQEAVTVS